MTEIIFSVIIPVYNGEAFIRRAIDSVLSQTFKNFELIVVNDGSVDKTDDILRSYGKQIKLINQTNGGVSFARNNGFKNAKGNYIAYLDADDQWLPDKLEIYHSAFDRHDVDFIFSELNRTIYGAIDGSRRNGDFFPIIHHFGRETSNKKIKIFTNIEILKLICKGYPFYPSTFAVKRQVLDIVQWDRKFKYSEDLLFTLRCSQLFSFAYIDIPLTLIDRHDANASSDLFNMYKNDANAFNTYASEVNNYKIKYHCWRAASYKYLNLFQHHANNKRYREATKYLVKSLRIPLFIPMAIKRIISVFLINNKE